MPAAKTVNPKNLEALGSARLAELLFEVSASDPAIKRRLRLELAGQAGAGDVAREIQKRISTLAKATSFVDWKRSKRLGDDLEAHHRAIVDVVAKSDPTRAYDLLWRFMELIDPIMARCDDSSGDLGDIFHSAAMDLPALAVAAQVQPDEVARNVFGALRANGYGQYNGLISAMAGALGPSGIEALKQRILDWAKETPAPRKSNERKAIGYGSSGPIYADDMEGRSRERTVASALRDIADCQGDVDAFIGQYTREERGAPQIAVNIAGRLLKAGRAAEALTTIDAVDLEKLRWASFDWRQVRMEALRELGRAEEAKSFEWSCFSETLDGRYLRSYLKGLPDFEDVEAEERAMALALGKAEVNLALTFLIEWPALDRANALILARSDELDGDDYMVLGPAADALEARYPLAATLVRRAMIDFALNATRAKRYPHAARHLAECAADAARIKDFQPHLSHEAYLGKLRAEHGRKAAFWQSVRSKA